MKNNEINQNEELAGKIMRYLNKSSNDEQALKELHWDKMKKEASRMLKDFIPHFANFSLDVSSASDIIVDISAK